MKKPILLLILSFTLVGMVQLTIAYGSSMTIRPNGDNGTNQWTLTASTKHYDAVDEGTVDDADYVKEGTLNEKDEWDMQDVSSTIPGGATIDSVLLTERGKCDMDLGEFENQGRTAGLKIGSDYTWGTERTNVAYTTYTQKLSAPGGRSWSRENLDSLIVSVKKSYSTSTSYYAYTSWSYATVYYNSGSTLVIRPNGDNGTNQWTLTVSTKHYDAVDEGTVNDADYVKEGTLNEKEEWDMQNVTSTIPPGATIDSVLLIERGKSDLDGSFDLQGRTAGFKVGSDYTWGTERTSVAYTTYTQKLSAPGGRSWSRENLDSLIVSVKKSYSGGATYYVYTSWSYATVYYTVDTSPPDTVTAVDTTAVTTTSVSLKCHKNDSTDCTGYIVRYAAGATAPSTYNAGTYGDSSDANGRNDTTFTVSGLSVNTQYSFSIFAKDEVPNWTVRGSTSSKTAYTKASAPSAPTISNPTSSSIDLVVRKNSNPATTNFAIWVSPAVGGNDYVQANGSIGASAVWQDSATWGTKTITGLSPFTTYYFKVKARNGDLTETAFSDSANGTTIPTGSTIALSDDFNDNSLDGTKWTERIVGGTSDAQEQNQRMELYLNHTAHCGAEIYSKNKYAKKMGYSLSADFQTNFDSAEASGYDGIWILRGDTSGTNFWDEYYGAPTTGLFIRIGVGCNYNNDGVGIYYDNDLSWECGWDTTVGENTANIIDTSSTRWYGVKFNFNGSTGVCSLWVDNTLKCTGTLGSNWLSDLGDSVRFAMHSSHYNTTTKLDKYDNFVVAGIDLDLSPPDTVTGVDTTAVATTSVSLVCAQNDSADCGGYMVRYAAGATAPATYDAGTFGDSTSAIDDTTFTVSGLSANTQYSFSIFARDEVPNWTAKGSGSSKTVYTKANVPSAPTVADPTCNTMNVTVNKNGNPATTEFAIWITPAVGGNNYVQADGTVNTSAVWEDSTTWATKRVVGLSTSTSYYFKAKARNGDNIETAFGDSANQSTTAQSVSACTVYVAADTTPQDWDEVPTDTTCHYCLVDDPAGNHDYNVTAILTDTNAEFDWLVPDTNQINCIPDSRIIDSVVVKKVTYCYNYGLGGEGASYTYLKDGPDSVSSGEDHADCGVSDWTDFSWSSATHPSGSAWTKTNLKSTILGLKSSTSGVIGIIRCTQLYYIVYHSPVSLSISVSPTTWNLDTLNASQIRTMVTGEKIKVKNDGNVAEQLSLKIDTMDTKGEWSCSNLANGQGVNTYVMSGIFAHKDSTADSSDFNPGDNGDVIDTLTQWAESDTFALGTQAVGANVAVNDSLYLWLQMKMPTTASGSKADSTRNIILQIGCQQAP